MLDADTVAKIKATQTVLINDNPKMVVFMRDGVGNLPAQKVRIGIQRLRPYRMAGKSMMEATRGVVIVGDSDLDIQAGDRFVDNGQLYRVYIVQKHVIGTHAEGEIVE